jgi:hypothetical protein
MTPNFAVLDISRPGRDARRRDAAGTRRGGQHPQAPANEEWWPDVLARRERHASDLPVRRIFYTLADEPRETILVACSKCDWRAAFSRVELIASHGTNYAMPNLLDDLAKPGCSRRGSMWDRSSATGLCGSVRR